MEVKPPAQVRPLHRRKNSSSSAYRTADGDWEIVLDPNEYTELGICGSGVRAARRAWYIYPTSGRHAGVDHDLPVFIGGTRAWPTLRDAVEALATAPIVDVEPAD